jgi:hypothetical protein
MVLTLLTYCYATGRYSSDEIEASLLTDPVVGRLCAGRFLTSDTIRRFRRLNRGPLGVSLQLLQQRAWHHRFGSVRCLGAEAGSPTASSSLGDAEFVYAMAATAAERIRQALLADTLALDV